MPHRVLHNNFRAFQASEYGDWEGAWESNRPIMVEVLTGWRAWPARIADWMGFHRWAMDHSFRFLKD